MRGRLLILVGLILLLVVIVVVVLSTGILNQAPRPAVTNAPGTSAAVNVSAGPTATPIPLVRVLIATQNLDRGFRFSSVQGHLVPNVVDWRLWPAASVPFDALREDNFEGTFQGGTVVDHPEVVDARLGNMVTRTDIRRETPILTAYLVQNLFEAANVGSDAAAVMPQDRVGVALPIDRQTSVAYGIRDGDHVDVVVSMLFVDVDEVFQSLVPNRITLFNFQEGGDITFTQGIDGRTDVTTLGPAILSPSERQRPRLVTQRTILDALVVHVGNFPLNGRFIGVPPTPTPVPQEGDTNTSSRATAVPPTPVPLPDIVTLGVTPQEAVVLVWYIEAKLPVTLLLRSAVDQSKVPTENVTLDYIMTQYRISVPGKRDYSIEPAITSIRQLVAGQEVPLTDASGN
ncbi:MAG: hypothetical protein K8I60_22470 [Anaerolineae bacterium]|nr:hypothetical protein [Anaerolineae bacterium]